MKAAFSPTDCVRACLVWRLVHRVGCSIATAVPPSVHRLVVWACVRVKLVCVRVLVSVLP